MQSAEAQWQAALLTAICDPQATFPDATPAALDVYRNNYRLALIGTMNATYPVIQTLVGEEFFTGLARMYLKQHPSLSGNLHHYGSEFGHFLESFGPAQEFPYLGDVARLEWRVHCARYARDAVPIDPASFGSVTPDEWPRLILHFAPAVGLVRSPWPISTIWNAHQQDTHGDWRIDLDSGAEAALVTRSLGDEVVVDHLPPATGAWLCQLLRGATLEAATEQALEATHNEEFDLQGAMQLLLTRQAITGFELQGPPEEDCI